MSSVGMSIQVEVRLIHLVLMEVVVERAENHSEVLAA
jgi:hypothetical protein